MDIFSIPLLICVLIIVVSLGLIYYWVNLKLKEQDHKLETMLSLVSTLVNEVNVVKAIHSHGIKQIVKNDLIEVSSNEGNYNDEDSDSDSDSDTNDNDNDDDKTEEEMLSIVSGSSLDNDDLEEEEEKDDVVEDVVDEVVEDDDNIKRIHINLEDEILVGGTELDESIDINLGNSENLNDEEDTHKEQTNFNLGEKETDYKKMSINGLREVVVKKGLLDTEAASKLKKNEILKLLH